MYTARLTPDLDVLKKVRSLPSILLPAFGEYVDTTVRDAIQQDIDDLLRPYPPVRGPGRFEWSENYEANQRARRWYFANYKGRMPYQRTNDLANAWYFKIDRRQNKGYVSIYNDDPGAIWVIGKQQVISHREQGWAANFPSKEDRIRVHLSELLIEGWIRIGGEALRD